MMVDPILKAEPALHCGGCDGYATLSVAFSECWFVLVALMSDENIPDEARRRISRFLKHLERLPAELDELEVSLEAEAGQRLQGYQTRKAQQEGFASKMGWRKATSMKDFLASAKELLLPVAGKPFSL